MSSRKVHPSSPPRPPQGTARRGAVRAPPTQPTTTPRSSVLAPGTRAGAAKKRQGEGEILNKAKSENNLTQAKTRAVSERNRTTSLAGAKKRGASEGPKVSRSADAQNNRQVQNQAKEDDTKVEPKEAFVVDVPEKDTNPENYVTSDKDIDFDNHITTEDSAIESGNVDTGSEGANAGGGEREEELPTPAEVKTQVEGAAKFLSRENTEGGEKQGEGEREQTDSQTIRQDAPAPQPPDQPPQSRDSSGTTRSKNTSGSSSVGGSAKAGEEGGQAGKGREEAGQSAKSREEGGRAGRGLRPRLSVVRYALRTDWVGLELVLRSTPREQLDINTVDEVRAASYLPICQFTHWLINHLLG